MLNKKKTLILITTTLLLLNLATADVTFDDPNDVKYYTGLEMWESDSENNKVVTISHDGTDQGITITRGKIDLQSNKIIGLANPTNDGNEGSGDAVNIGYANDNYLTDDGDSINGNLDMLSNDIINLEDPDNSQDAATKNYVDTEVSSIQGSQGISDVLEQNSTANQTINLSNNKIIALGTPSSSGDAVNLGYVNTNYIKDNGDSINGSLDLLTHQIKNVKNPDDPQDAATKDYVDTEVTSNVEANTDNQTLSINNNVNNQDDNISIGNGNTVTIDDYFEANTNTQIDTTNASSNVNMNNYKIVSIADPSSSGDAVNLGYANDNYFDRNNGDSINGSVDLLNHDITNLQDPDSSQDAANKRYVDDQISANVEANTDNQTLNVNNDVTGTSDNISIGNGNTVQVDDDFEANTNTQLDDQKAQSNVDMNGNNITSSGGEFCVGSEC